MARGAGDGADPLPLADGFAAAQFAMLETLLPIGGLPIVDAARWAALAAGAVAALLLWPALRSADVSPPAAAVGVIVLGASLPALVLHTAVSAAAPAAAWLVLAAVLIAKGWGRGVPAAVAAVLAVLTAPLAAAPLLALGAYLVWCRTVRTPGWMRWPLVAVLGLAALAVAVAALDGGPLAGAAGPQLGTPLTAAGLAVGLVVLLLAVRSAAWLRPVLAAAALLLVLGLVPGPSRATVALLAAPMLAAAVAVLADQAGAWATGRVRPELPIGGLLAVLVVPTLVAFVAAPPAVPAGPSLLAWVVTEPAPGTVVRADALDRAELVARGVPAQRLRGPGDPRNPGELLLVADRPGTLPATAPTRCPDDSTVAFTARGTAGAPGAVCRTDGGAAVVAGERVERARLGTALTQNPALQLAPPAAAALGAGSVDPRLMLVLAASTTAHRLSVTDFPAADLDAPGIPRRLVLLATVDGADAGSSDMLRTWLAAQDAPFQPAVVRQQGSALLVGYPAPPPGGLLP